MIQWEQLFLSILYEDFEFVSSFVTDNNLVCEDQYKVALIGTIYMAGFFCGSFIWGNIGDKFGRKITLMYSIIIASIFSLIGAFSSNYYYYGFTRFMTAIG